MRACHWDVSVKDEIPTERKWPSRNVLLAVEGDFQGCRLGLLPVKPPPRALAVDVVRRIWRSSSSKWIGNNLGIGDFNLLSISVSTGRGRISVQHLHVVAGKVRRNQDLGLNVPRSFVDQWVGDDWVSVVEQLDLVFGKLVALDCRIDVDGVPVDDFRIVCIFDVIPCESLSSQGIFVDERG